MAEENADLFSKLPEEILVSIITSFTMNEAARFSLVSRQCEVVWRYFPVLIFEDCKAKEKVWNSWDAIFEDRASFVRRVDRVLEKHLGTTIDELRITFDLERSWQSNVDKWVAFALDKQLKRLEHNFSTIYRGIYLPRYDGQLLNPPPKLTGFKSCLTSLCLRHVNVTDEFIDYLPHSCPLLEMLCIEGSSYLTRVTGALSVKQLEVYYCPKLKKINVSARKLHSFTLFGVFPVEVHIVDAPSLIKMSVGWGEILPHALDYLSDILSQLVYLKISLDLGLPIMVCASSLPHFLFNTVLT
ncbi:putative F-box/LRR-repeat protein At4g15060 [Silene latifolia]|uniref:putative F-box/LRR-repeat protein At4g15060 n=1 Tax=Silene latifolia TaxID=37657 RepID=UPI003D7847F8